MKYTTYSCFTFTLLIAWCFLYIVCVFCVDCCVYFVYVGELGRLFLGILRPVFVLELVDLLLGSFGPCTRKIASWTLAKENKAIFCLVLRGTAKKWTVSDPKKHQKS